MRSASRHIRRFAALAICALGSLSGLSGCTTTQEKAARHKAQAEHILKARAERQRHKHDKSGNTDKDGNEKR